jgi:predicted phage terminase large subunit-like protein
MTPHPAHSGELLLAGARHDFGTFLELTFALLNPGVSLSKGWYLAAIVHALDEISNGSNRRLQITVPPRHLKSITTTVAFAAWMMGRDPTYRIICASYGQDLAVELSRDFRKVVQSGLYRAIFPGTAASIVKDTDTQVRTRQGGGRLAVGVGGAVTGFGADLIIIDDLMKAADASFPEARAKAQRYVDETLLTRLNDKARGAVVAIQQRLHEDDVSAHLTAKGGYRHLDLPAIALRDEIIPLTHGRVHARRIGQVLNPERESMEVLEGLRMDLGPRVFETQYQQNPTPADGDVIRWDRIQFYDEDPIDFLVDEGRRKLSRVVISWDCADSVAATADYSVGTVWGYDGACWRLLDVIQVRLGYADLLARVRSERKRWRADKILVENASVGPAILDMLSQDTRCQSDPRHHAPWCVRQVIKPRVGKAERYAMASEPLYSGRAKLPRDAPWLDDLRKEMMGFPNARHDDQVDSLSQFLNWMVLLGGRQLLDQRRDHRRAA